MCIDLHASDFFQFETVLCVIQLDRCAQILGTRLPWQLNCVHYQKFLCILSMKLASCHTSCAQNFDVAPRFLECLCTPCSKPARCLGCVFIHYGCPNYVTAYSHFHILK